MYYVYICMHACMCVCVSLSLSLSLSIDKRIKLPASGRAQIRVRRARKNALWTWLVRVAALRSAIIIRPFALIAASQHSAEQGRCRDACCRVFSNVSALVQLLCKGTAEGM